MHALLLAAADFGDWLKLIVGVGAILFYIINHLINESTQARKRQQQQQQRKLASAGQRPPDAAMQPQPGARDEIQEFLRRAAQQRKETAARKEPPRSAPAQRRPSGPRERPPAQRPPAQRSPEQRPPQRPQPVAPPPRRYVEPLPAEVQLEALETVKTTESLGEQVTRKFASEDSRFSTEDLGARGARLTDEIARADTERELHFQKTFTHQLGNLTSKSARTHSEPAATVTHTDTAADALGGLLQGGGLRYAVLLNEILNRPEHRW